MKLISQIEIKGFRSIRSINLSGMDDFTTFAGLNNSGKSNVLRALNAFFNGQTDEGKQLDVDSDYFRPDLKLKKAKQISVAVKFTLPDHFRFRKGLEPVKQLLEGRDFKIKKTWSRKKPLPIYHLEDREINLEERLRIDQFLQLINFRYIPNRVLPVDVVRQEHQALRDVLVRRLGRRGQGQEQTFDTIQETSQHMIRALVDHLKEASPDIGTVRLATPTSWADMAFTFGYRLGIGGIEVDDAVQGAGIQSLLMLETLHLIDRDYFQKFGWRQAAVWAVEEPESSLHTTLEARVASYLSSIAQDSSSRLQIFSTTHSELMLQYATKTVIFEKQGWETIRKIAENPRDAIKQVSRLGISRWIHPILYFPLDPLILVDGKYDANFLDEAFQHIRPKRKVHVIYLEQLEEGGKTGGVNDILGYVKANAQAIKARRKEAPVIVVLDWESANKEGSFKKLFDMDDPFKVFVWPESDCNPKLDESFRGIERFFSTRIIQEGKKRGAKINKLVGGEYLVKPEDREKAKKILNAVAKDRIKDADLQYCRNFLEKILQAAEAV